jgi:hypothetical protein
METGYFGATLWPPSKQQALLFDAVVLPESVLLDESTGVRGPIQQLDPEAAYLFEAGITRYVPLSLSINPEGRRFLDALRAHNEASRTRQSEGHKESEQEHDAFSMEFAARLGSMNARKLGMYTVPILPGITVLRMPDSVSVDVTSVVVPYLPSPTDEVSWEQIVDFRADHDARASLRRLRRWMHNLDSEKLSASEVHEELDYLLHEYESHMNYHKMKFRKGIWRTFITFPFEAIENIIKVRLKNTVDALYRVDDL